jgi:hypothetical protein
MFRRVSKRKKKVLKQEFRVSKQGKKVLKQGKMRFHRRDVARYVSIIRGMPRLYICRRHSPGVIFVCLANWTRNADLLP